MTWGLDMPYFVQLCIKNALFRAVFSLRFVVNLCVQDYTDWHRNCSLIYVECQCIDSNLGKGEKYHESFL